MGSNDTATATTGGPRVIDVFDGNGAPSGLNYTIFSGQIGPWRSLELGLVVGSRRYRIRRRCDSPRALEAIPSHSWFNEPYY
jgi:hypothetical protein